ncbi:UNVERIFIED_CONTAM: hypothetical protein RMT77_004783 [Armadillidium vulgare]
MACIRSSESTGGSTDNINKINPIKNNTNSNINNNNNKKSITQIYTDWANHYLEKSRSKRHITDLQGDVTDGVILADVIEAVTCQKIPDINKKPKTSAQMLDNISSSLSFLVSIGVQLDGLTPKDIREGNLKAILSLFFALSRYKQQHKQALQERKELEKLREKKQESEMVSLPSRLGSPYKGQPVGGGSSIPTPALGGRKPPSDHHGKNSTRLGGSSGNASGSQLKGIPSASSSRSTSPANGSASFIPTPRNHSNRASTNEKHKSSNSSNGNRPVLRGPSPGNANGPYHSAKQKDSMLEKFKLFNNKEKDSKSKNNGNNGGSGVSKRTSSSSGFSSARSERSDSSSTSLCSDVRPPPLPPHQNLPGSTTSSSSSEQTSGYPEYSSAGKSPGLRGIRSRFSRSSKEGKESSPKSSRRSEDRESSKGSPRSAHRGHRSGDSRDREREKGREKEGKSDVKEGRKADKLTLNLDTGSRCMSSATQVDNSNRTSKLASISSSAKAVQQPKSPTMPQIPSPSSPLSSSGVGTGIPKPTAAVKGTTKSVPDKSSPSSPNVNSPSSNKEYPNKIARNSPAPPIRRTPIGGEAPPTPELRDPKGSLPRQRNLGRREDSNPPSVAMVSPMPVNNINNNNNNNNNNNQVSASESGSALSEMSQNSGHSNSNSSGGSSVIYKPSSEDENIEKPFNKDIGDKIFKQEDSEDVIIDVKPMQPLIRAAQYGYIRGLGGHNGRALPPSLHVSRMALQENSHTVPQKGMRIAPPHLRRHLTPGSPRSPGHIQGHIIDGDYSDLECIDLANGYLSDGDVLRSNIGCTTYPPPNMDGYLSEGGASLYAHRLNQRLKEGMRQVHETMSRAQHFMHDDSNSENSNCNNKNSNSSEHRPKINCTDVVSATEVALLNAINSCNFDRISAALSSADSEATEDASSCGSSRISSSFPLSDAREDESDVNDSNNKNFNDKMGIEGDIYFLRQNTTTKKKERSEATLTEPPRKRRQYQTEDNEFGAIHFDDSSSLSSGVSDTLNELSEDFLSASLTSEQTAVVAKAKGLKEVGLKLPVGLSGPSPRKATMGMDPSGAYKVVSSKAHVKKTESSQQTEGQPFKQISNTQWKKYVDNGKANVDMRDYQRGMEMNGSNSSRKFDQKKTNFGPAITSNPNLGQNSGMVNPQVNNSRKTERKTVGGAEKREKILTPSPQVNGDTKKIQNPKTAPSNFGYSKKVGCNSSSSSTGKTVTSKSKESDPSTNSNGRDSSSHSLDRPRTKLKVSGGTQTTSDLQYMPNTTGFHSDGEYSSNSLGRKYQQIKSYSLNGPAAAQLSQGVRERILQSPYRKVHMSGGEYSPYGQGFYRERSPRLKATDGSLSDNPYSNYAEIQYNSNPYGSPYSWVARNNYAPSVASAPTRQLGGSLTEAESMESLTSSTSSFAAQLQHARATSLTPARLMMHQREMSTSPSPRLARSNSVSHLIERTFPRSTKSEKVLGLRDGYHSSQPTSPTPPSCSRLPMSPLNTSRGSAYYTPSVSRTSKDDECHGSSLSLVSSSSSLYSSQEDKHAHEVRKLKRDLSEAQDKVITLTNQLTTNAHVVAAFEQSLTNMTNRLQQLTATSEQKECELSELRRTIDALRQQSIDAGLTVASLQSMSKELNKIDSKFKNPLGSLTPSKSPAVSIRSKSCLPPSSPASAKPPPHPQQPSNNSNNSSTNNVSCSALHVCSSKRTPQSSTPEKNGTEFARRHTFTGTCRDLKVSCEGQSNGGNLVRGTSVESVSSLSSACSGTSHTSNHDKNDNSKLGKKKGWLRSSFTKAFSRNNKNKKLSGGSFSDADDSKQEGEGLSVPSSPLPTRGVTEGEEQQTSEGNSETTEEIELLKRQLWEKDMVLTDIRLEALTSAHQLESLKETINKMRSEMKSLKEDNDRLQRLMASESLASSRSSLPPPDISTDVPPRPLSLTEEVINIDDPTDVLLIDPLDRESKRGTVSVFMGCHGEYEKYMDPSDGSTIQECVIGAISISSKTKWDTLDSLVRRIFKEYLLRVDPSSNLGINSDSIVTYHLGEVTRGRNSPPPELLPCGYLVGEVTNVRITLKGAVINCVDALAFETLIPKSIVQRYISLLTEHRRIILCGPSGTGKTFLAQKLAEFLVCRLGKDPSPGNIATFSVDHKTNKDLGAYLSHVSEQCENNASELPLVIILDNLHYAGALTEVFNGFLSAKYTQCPFIIGTMIQATSCSTTNLQLHHNFRWVLMANHIEPVKGLLAKVSRRKLTHVEVETCTRQPRLQQVLDWLPKCWSHINKFLETHSSSDVTIGPRLFLSCPSSVEGSQVWFADLWNYSLVPYMVEAVREGLQLYGKRASWEDPSTWIQETYPWVQTAHGGAKSLVSLRPEDVGYDTVNTPSGHQDKNSSENEGESDPLLSMLMRLQEAANFSPQQDTATVSLENMENALESTL